MNPIAARTILATLSLAGIAWTVRVHYLGWPVEITSSCTINRIVSQHPMIAALLLLVFWGVLCDALPTVDKWVVLWCVLVPAVCLGHATWPCR